MGGFAKAKAMQNISSIWLSVACKEKLTYVSYVTQWDRLRSIWDIIVNSTNTFHLALLTFLYITQHLKIDFSFHFYFLVLFSSLAFSLRLTVSCFHSSSSSNALCIHPFDQSKKRPESVTVIVYLLCCALLCCIDIFISLYTKLDSTVVLNTPNAKQRNTESKRGRRTWKDWGD